MTDSDEKKIEEWSDKHQLIRNWLNDYTLHNIGTPELTKYIVKEIETAKREVALEIFSLVDILYEGEPHTLEDDYKRVNNSYKQLRQKYLGEKG